ncbi:MAG: hypothetical protein RML35_07185 [Chloroherpetonaceae bacterium]|nr:hypothetical protein [Chloroherpetonaceae bacterium]MCS7211762.1 hypothetical protein [Chloroherpetonaceae bacterium]MDW8465953.1 hypothetical protein [Chloroherpetonaceae bacterium]
MNKHSSQSNMPDDLDALIYRTMVEMQWIEPISDETLKQDEQDFRAARKANEIHLPQVLESPDVILAKLQKRHQAAGRSIGAEIQEQMARAAREGGAVPPEVEEQMRRDRAAAEAKLQMRKGYEDLFS